MQVFEPQRSEGRVFPQPAERAANARKRFDVNYDVICQYIFNYGVLYGTVEVKNRFGYGMYGKNNYCLKKHIQ